MDQLTLTPYKNVKLPKIVKGVGKNTCFYASLGNILPITETQIHEIMDNQPLPRGLDIYQGKEILETKLSPYAKNAIIFHPKDVSELKTFILEKHNQGSKIIANFQLQPIYPDYPNYPDIWANYGHFSPIIYVDETQVCIGDVWRKVPDYCWRSYEILFNGVNTIDGDSNKKRGLLVFDLVE